MHPDALRNLLERVARHQLDVETAMGQLRRLPYESLEHATLDHHRALRCGFPEVVFGQGKSDEQIEELFCRLAQTGNNVLATRVPTSAAERVRVRLRNAVFDRLSHTLMLRQKPAEASRGYVGVIAAGTSDAPVAEEARITAEIMDQPVKTAYDVGVAGLHRLLSRMDMLTGASALVVVAGMEGALPSVVGGLVSAPVIAVPTSVGYGASLGGVAALLGMLNTCAPGVCVVNIDNGFAAGYQAAIINRLASAPETQARAADQAPAQAPDRRPSPSTDQTHV